jgi:hypothetical protein
MTFPHGVLDIDRVTPLASWVSPGSGTTVSGTITLAVNASDNDQVTSVQFQVDGANIGSPITASPYQVNHDTSTVTNGNRVYSAIVTDRVGNKTTIYTTTNVANLPNINFYSPGNGATVTGVMTLAAYVTQYGSGVSVYFYVDGANIYAQGGGTGYYSVAYDTHYLGVGWHTITCITVDYQGNQSRIDYGVYVNNQPPGAGITSLGELRANDGSGGYPSDRSPPEAYDGSQGDWIWSATGAKWTPVYLPANPDPTHYQMRVWWHGDRVEGGSAGNIVYIDFQVAGIAGWTSVWANGPAYTNIGPLWNVNGGEACYAKRWCTQTGINNCFAQGIGFYYDFVPRPGYAS